MKTLSAIGLSEENFYEARDGEEALDLLDELVNHEEREIHLVLLDWYMPKLDGLSFLQLIKKNNDLKHIPVIMVSSEGSKEALIAAMRAGVTDYVVKPFTVKKLQDKVAKVLNDE